MTDRQLAARFEMFRRGDLSFLYHAGQEVLNQTFNNAPGAVVVFNVSRQFGKTFFAVSKAIEIAHNNDKAQIRYGAAFQTDLENFVLPAFDIILTDCPEDIRPQYISSRNLWKFPNGSEIHLVGLDLKPNGMRGGTTEFIVIDEAGFCSKLEYLHTSVIVPLTTHRPDCKILIISTPPESPDHYFWELADRAKLESAYCEFTIDENPALSKDDVARIEREMGGRDTTAFQREYLCKRIIEASKAIIPEWKTEYEIEPIIDEYFPYYQRVEGMDIGVKRDLTVNLYAHYDFKRAILFVHDEVAVNGPEMNTESLAKLIRTKETDLWKELKVTLRVADNSHPLLVQDLSQLHNLAFRETDKGTLQEMVNLVKIRVAAGRIRVSPKCKQLVGCLRSGIWNEKRTEFSHSKLFGHYDALAALIYLVRNIDENYNPIPAHFGKSRYTHFLDLEPDVSSTNAKKLQKAFNLRRK